MPPKKRKAIGSGTTPNTNKRVTRSATKPSAPVEQGFEKLTKAELKSSKASKATTKASPTSKATRQKDSGKVKPKSEKTKTTPKASSGQQSASTSAKVETLSFTSDLIKDPIQYSSYPPSDSSSASSPTVIFTHGAGGTLQAPAVVNICTGFASQLPVHAFQGSMNLGSRVKGFHASIQHLREKNKKGGERLVLGGRSMGARAAVLAASEVLATSPKDTKIDIVLVSYPLKGPKDTRDQILLDLPASVGVLFIIGDRDSMCPLELLDGVRSKMKAQSQLVIVRGADHGMHTKPARVEKQVGEESGRVAAEWVAGRVSDEVIYIGEEA